MKKFFVALFTLCFLVLAVGNLHAQNQTQHQVRGILDYSKELGLNQNQINTIKTAINNFEAKARELNKKMQTLANEINSLLNKENLSMDTIAKKIREFYNLRAELDIANIEAARKISNTLTPQQRKKWHEIRAREMQKLGGETPKTTTR